MGRSALHALVAAAIAIGGASACRAPEPVTCGDLGGPPVASENSRPSFDSAPDPSIAAGVVWEAIVSTTCGDIVVRLDEAAAPRAVASFIELARTGYWEGSGCDRLTAHLAPSRVLQCGDAPGRALTSPGYDLAPENVPVGHRYERGMVGMVTPGFHGASGGEFFFVYEDFTAGPGTMGEPAVVGSVVSGMEVLDVIAAAGVEDGVSDWHPFTNVDVQSVSVRRGALRRCFPPLPGERRSSRRLAGRSAPCPSGTARPARPCRR